MIDAAAPSLDISQAKAFVSALTGSPETAVLLVAILPATGDTLAIAVHKRGSISQLWSWVESQQQKHFGVFITVNDTAAATRKKNDITRVRAVYIDNDKVADTWRKDAPLAPHIVVQSSPGKFHLYWLTDAEPDKAFETLMQAAAQQLDADQSATDINRVLRLPGTLHLKDPTRAHLVCMVHHDSRARYTPAELFEAFHAGGTDDIQAGPKAFAPSTAMDTIESGSEGLHAALRDMAASMVARGWSADMATRMLTGYTHHHSDGTPRFQQRIAEIPDLVRSAEAKFHKPDGLDGKDPFDLFTRSEQKLIFNPGHYPSPIGDLARDIAKRTGCDPLIPAWSAIGVLSGILPNNFALQVKAYDTEWRERSRLWIAFIGDPSTKKSPGIAAVLKALEKIEAEGAKRHTIAMARWANDCAAAKRDKTAVPPQPIMQRALIGDATTEAIAMVLNDNPAGLLSCHDELSGWFGTHDAYRATGVSKDRAFWLQAFNGGPYTVDRASKGAIHVAALSVALLGGIQPSRIREISAKSADDGLLQRFITITVSPATGGVDSPPDHPALDSWGALVRNINDLRQGCDWHEIYRLAPAAQEVVDAARRRLLAIADSPAVEGRLMAALLKAEGQLARLILINHLAEYRASDDLFNISDRPSELVSKATAARACDVFFSVVVPSTFDFYNRVIGASERQEQARRVAGYILAKGLQIIADRDVYREALHELQDDERARGDVMRHLELAGWLQPTREVRGRTSQWSVNPRVHSKFAEQAIVEKERRRQVVETIRKGLK